MTSERIPGILEFPGSAERLKNVTRTSWTSEGNRESVAEHTCANATHFVMDWS